MGNSKTRGSCAWSRWLFLLSVGGGLLCGESTASAAICTWTGAGADSNWNTADNWGGTAPAATGDSLVFDGTTQLTNVNSLPVTSVAGITYNSTAGAFLSSGPALTLAGDLNDGSTAVQTLSMPLAISGAHTVTVADGGKLVLGASGASNAFSVNNGASVFTGASVGVGEIDVLSTGNFTVGPSNATTLDMSGLATFSAGVATFKVGSDTAAVASTVTLAGSNSITATNINVGSGTGSLVSNGTLKLGSTNTLQADSFAVGQKRSSGTITFNAGLTNPTATITGKAGGASKASMTVGYYQTNPGAYNPTGILDFTGGTLNAQLSTLVLGQQTPNGNIAANNCTAAGTFTVDGAASTVTTDTARLGYWSSGSTGGAGTTQLAQGTLNIKNGTVTISDIGSGLLLADAEVGATNTHARGNVNVGGGALTVSKAFTIGDRNAGSASPANVRGTLSITGGTVTSNVDITTKDAQSTLTLNGGTLDLTNHAIGSSTQQIGSNGGALSFQSGTLQNVAEINGGAGLSKTTTGTLTIAGTNTYTGPTPINAGTLNVTGTLGNTAVAVNAGATLSGSGTIGGTVTVTGGATTANQGTINLQDNALHTLAIGSGSGTALTLGGTNPGDQSVLSFDVGSTGADRIDLGTASLVLNTGGAVVNINALAGLDDGTYNLITYNSPTLTGAFIKGTVAGLGLGDFEYILTPTSTALQLSVSGGNAWQSTSSTDWDTPENWSKGAAPDSGVKIKVGVAGTVGTIEMPAARTIGGITFRGEVPTTIQGAGTFTLQGTTAAPVTVSGTGNVINTAGVTLGSNATFTVNAGGELTVTSPIGESTPCGITKSGDGLLTLSATNSFSGGTTINGGTLRISGDAALGTAPSTAAINLTFSSNSTLQAGGASVDLVASRNVAIQSGVTATFDTGSDSISIAGVVSGNGGGLTKIGSGTLALAGGNTYTGRTTINDGALRANDDAGLVMDSLLVLNGGVLEGNGAAQFTRPLGTSGVGVFQWTVQGGGFSARGGKMTVDIGRVDTTPGPELIWGGSGDVGNKLVGTLRFGSSTANNQTELKNPIDLAGADRTIDVTPGTGGDYATLSGTIRNSNLENPAGLVKTGGGVLELASATNSYDGGTKAQGGILLISNAGALPTGQSLAISAGGTVVLASGLSGAAGAAASGTPAPSASAVPEPGTLALVFAGLAVAKTIVYRRRRLAGRVF